jgi:DNA-binding GntR family transcriptional regulator
MQDDQPLVDSCVSLSEIAYKRFKECLFTRRIALGAVVSQGELVDVLDVPLTPLRDAVHRLQSEGLVEIMPRSGIRVLKPDMELIRHTCQLRMIIEREGIRRYAEFCPAEELEHWVARHKEVEEALAANMQQPEIGNLTSTIDNDFHFAVVGSLKNPIIDETYRRTRDRIALIRLDQSYVLSPPLIRATMREHGKILAALAEHDRDAAAAAMDAHLMQSMHRALGV